MNTQPLPDEIRNLERPQSALWAYYVILSLCTGPGVIVALPYHFFRYHTLRYRFDDEGIHMKVGILFRREVNLTYARIQDIHLRSNILQRWLGLADVQLQTASGSSGPEMVIEGFKHFEVIRDFLYTRMRGYQSARPAPGQPLGTSQTLPGTSGPPELVSVLEGIRDELRQTRELLAAKIHENHPETH